MLSIQWEAPVSNAESVNDYLVQVLQYFQPAGSQEVETRHLNPAFQQQVRSGELLKTFVTSGVGRCYYNTYFPYVQFPLPSFQLHLSLIVCQ